MVYRSIHKRSAGWSARILYPLALLLLFVSVNYTFAEITPDEIRDHRGNYCRLEIDDGTVVHGTVKRLRPAAVIIKTDYGSIFVEYDRIISVASSIKSESDSTSVSRKRRRFLKKVGHGNMTIDSESEFAGPEMDESAYRYRDGRWLVHTDYQELSDMQKRILDEAWQFMDKKPNEIVYVKDRKFKLTCIGTVAAVFYAAGIDITRDFHRYKGNGVSNLYYILRDEGTLYNQKMPRVGDVVFWDNTWDRNKDNNRNNDPLTHIGIVVKIDDDGTIHYLHENYYYGIVVEKMNLYRPTVYKDESGKVINSAMYSGSSLSWHPRHWLAGDLFKMFGGILETGTGITMDEDE
jgi:hypothetical protein